MVLDFSKLGTGQTVDTVLHPREIFNALPNKNSSKFRYPRDVQSQVWNKWFERKDEANLVIKMNTGGGKTVVGLLISVTPALHPELSEDAFAIKITDDSMSPEIRVNDLLVIEPSISPEPGDFVAVKISGKEEPVICKYRKLSYSSDEFELLTLNDNWPNIKQNERINVIIIGKVIQNIRRY